MPDTTSKVSDPDNAKLAEKVLGWVRCDCGGYEPRTAKSIKNPNNTAERCSKCRQVEQAKRCHHYHTTGKDI